MHTLQSILPHQPKSELNNRIIDAGQRLVAIQLANLLATSGYQTLQHQIKTKKCSENKQQAFGQFQLILSVGIRNLCIS